MGYYFIALIIGIIIAVLIILSILCIKENKNKKLLFIYIPSILIVFIIGYFSYSNYLYTQTPYGAPDPVDQIKDLTEGLADNWNTSKDETFKNWIDKLDDAIDTNQNSLSLFTTEIAENYIIKLIYQENISTTKGIVNSNFERYLFVGTKDNIILKFKISLNEQNICNSVILVDLE